MNDINNEEKTTAVSDGQNDGKSNETATYYEKARQAILTLETWEEIADADLLRAMFKDKNISQTEKEVMFSILTEKSKKLKMHTEFKKIISLVKKEIAKDHEYMRSTLRQFNSSAVKPS